MKLNYGYVFIPLLIILGIYLYYDMQKRVVPGVPDVAGRVGFNKADAKVIEIQSGDGLIRIVNGTDGYHIESPINTPANPDTVNGLLDSMANAKVNRSLGQLDDASKAEYGLDNPAYRLDVFGEGGDNLLSFEIGLENTTGDERYVTMGKGELLLFKTSELAFTGIELNEFRTRDILDFAPGAITSFEVSTNEVDYAFRVEKDIWYITRPERFRASTDWCKGLFTLLGERAKVKAFADAADFSNLVPLKGGIRLLENDGTEHVIHFLGTETVKGVLAESSFQVGSFLTEFTVETYLNRTIEELRETRLIMLAESRIKSVKFRERDRDNFWFEWRDDEEEYVITKSETGYEPPQSDYQAFFRAVLIVSPSRFVDTYENLGSLGLEPFWIRIELYTDDESETVELYLGNEVNDGYYAKLNNEEQVYIIPGDQVDSILDAANKLRSG